MEKGKLDIRPAGRLLWAAALIDAFFAATLVLLVWPLVVSVIEASNMRQATPMPVMLAATAILLFLVLLLAYWILTELILRGRSIGRACLMLELRDAAGNRPPFKTIRQRAMGKLGCLGLRGLGLNKPDPYDVKCDLVWYSPLAPTKGSSARNWQLAIMSGANKGGKHVVGRIQRFKESGSIRFGRDSTWADIVLDQDEKVSSRHAELRFSKNGWQIMHVGRNPTLLNGRNLQREVPTKVPANSVIDMAGVKIKLSRGA